MMTTSRASILFSVPGVAMSVCWIAMFIQPRLGFSEKLKPFFLCLLLLSLVSSVGALVYFRGRRKSVDVVVCLVISIIAILLTIYGFIFAIGATVRAF